MQPSHPRCAFRRFQWNAKWRSGLAAALTNPEGIEAFSPALRGTSYAGLSRPRFQYPERVASGVIKYCYSTPSGLVNLTGATQGSTSRNRANPGLNDAILSGLSDGPLKQMGETSFPIPPKTARNLPRTALRHPWRGRRRSLSARSAPDYCSLWATIWQVKKKMTEDKPRAEPQRTQRGQQQPAGGQWIANGKTRFVSGMIVRGIGKVMLLS